MSHRKNMERALAGHPFRNTPVVETLYFKCGKCGATVAESAVTEHLVGTKDKPGCQPDKCECGKCQQYVPIIEFLEHIKNCKGKQLTPPGALVKEPEPPAGKVTCLNCGKEFEVADTKGVVAVGKDNVVVGRARICFECLENSKKER